MRRQQKPSVMTSCSCVLFYTALLLLTWGCSAVPTTREQLRSYFELDQDSPQEGGRAKRQAITRPTGKWPNATAYYGFDPTFPATGQDAVRMATAYWEANTCIRFTFVPDINNPPFQPVRTTTHEIAHSLGLVHEQSRYDRDNYIWVDFSNIAVCHSIISYLTILSAEWNDGRPNPNNCAVCQCPSGFGGNDCSQRQDPSAGMSCGATLAASAQWQWLSIYKTIGDGRDATANLTAPSHCTWHVTAPAGVKIEYYMNYIGIDGKPDALCFFACYCGGVSIKGIESNWITEGMRFCCPSQYSILMKTASNRLVIQPWSGYKYTDFQMQYRTECDQSQVVCYFNGVPNPLANCGVCSCQLGFGSSDCTQQEPPSTGLSCGQTIIATSGYQYLTVNNQVGNGLYQATWSTFEASAHCAWHIVVFSGLQIEYQVTFVGFDGNNNALCNSGCYNGGVFVKRGYPDWITYDRICCDAQAHQRGYPDWIAYDRICCDAQAHQVIVTAGNLLVLRPWNNYRYTDFQVVFRVKP
uniref:Astacin domain-containing protein n=1 Tax=Steinernema glaseri TaxID=37863 RepID=A0A1I8AJA8_9BILA